MSAFMVGDEHINTLIGWTLSKAHGVFSEIRWVVSPEDADRNPVGIRSTLGTNFRYLNPETASVVGQILVDANAKSIEARYEEDEFRIYEYNAPRTLSWNPVEIMSACSCYDYQSCESDDYKESEACAIIDAIRHLCISILCDQNHTPWEIRENSVSAREKGSTVII